MFGFSEAYMYFTVIVTSIRLSLLLCHYNYVLMCCSTRVYFKGATYYYIHQ